eukprot:349144_1
MSERKRERKEEHRKEEEHKSAYPYFSFNPQKSIFNKSQPDYSIPPKIAIHTKSKSQSKQSSIDTSSLTPSSDEESVQFTITIPTDFEKRKLFLQGCGKTYKESSDP